ncbi:MAG: L,D-transpeptidase [Geobacteraceae bacterium]
MRDFVNKKNPKRTARVTRFLRLGGWLYLGMLLVFIAITAVLFAHTAAICYQREVSRLVMKDHLETMEKLRSKIADSELKLRDLKQRPEPHHDRPYLVISLVERHLWYKQGKKVLLTTKVATGSGKELEKEDGASAWKFETPRGRLVVRSKEENPLWVPPDWFYVEQARKHKLGLMHLKRGQRLTTADGSTIKVEGANVVRVQPDGKKSIMEPTDSLTIVVDGIVLIPPLGTNQRRFKNVLGTHRLNLGNGYGIHGTNNPESVGQAVSHGCMRVINEDIDKLYDMVPVGTPVYIY